jgi:hypothetical protein
VRVGHHKDFQRARFHFSLIHPALTAVTDTSTVA